MSTIASLAIKLGMDSSNFLQGAQKTIQTAERIASSMVRNNAVVKTASAAWKAADNAAHGYLKTVVGTAAAAGVAAGVVAKLKSALAAGAKGEFADSLRGIKSALEGASNAFGSSFARWSNLREVAQKIENALINLKPAFAAAGAAVGAIIRPFVALLPIIAATAIALKGLAWIIGVALHIAITQVIVRTATWLILGKSMGTLSLAWAAGVKILAAAQWLYNGALAVTAALGIPVFAAMVAAASAVALAIGAVVAVATGMYFLWQRLTTADPLTKQAASAARLSEEFAEATKGARTLIDTIADEAAQLGLTDAQKKTAALAKELEKLHNAGIVVNHPAMEAELAHNLKMLDLAKKRKELGEMLAGLQQDAATAGLDAVQKAAAMVDRLGGSAREKQVAISLAEQVQSRERAADLARQIFDIEQAAARAGMSEMEQRLAGLRDAGATELQIAAIRARMEGAETAQRAAQTRLDIEKRIAELHNEAAFAALGAAEKELALARQRGATEEQIARLKGALDSATLAGKAAAITEQVKSDAERLAEKTQELQQLLSKGLITSETFDRAMRQAQQIADRANKKPDGPTGGSGTAAQGGAIFKGSQQDIAAKFRQPGDTNRGVEQNTAKTNVLLEKLVNRGERASSTVEVVNFN